MFCYIFSTIFCHQNLESGLDPDPAAYSDPDSLEMLDPDPYVNLDSVNPDPQHCLSHCMVQSGESAVWIRLTPLVFKVR
jgi:hypothetical protein